MESQSAGGRHTSAIHTHTQHSVDSIHIKLYNSRIRGFKVQDTGDPLSPGMTIGTCAWMEKEWMNTLSSQDKTQFCAARFMDDILMFFKRSEAWDHERFTKDFARSECYHPPLKLVDAKENTFLETTFEVTSGGNRIRHWLKNENPQGGPTKIWRYQHFNSAAPFEQKRATITACMKKVQLMASDGDALFSSALQKLAEFRELGYPKGVLKGVCTHMAAITSRYNWIQVRTEINGNW